MAGRGPPGPGRLALHERQPRRAVDLLDEAHALQRAADEHQAPASLCATGGRHVEPSTTRTLPARCSVGVRRHRQ